MNKIELENAIRHHNDQYWNGKELEISRITIKRVKLPLIKPVLNTGVNTCLIDGSLQIGDIVVIERAGDEPCGFESLSGHH